MRLAISRKLTPRSPIREPSGTSKLAVMRISNSCSARRCGLKAISSLKAQPVKPRNSCAEFRSEKTFSGRNRVQRCRKSRGICDWIPGSQALPEGLSSTVAQRRGNGVDGQLNSLAHPRIGFSRPVPLDEFHLQQVQGLYVRQAQPYGRIEY